MKRPKEDLSNHLNIAAISTNYQLLHLMQIHDSAFPIGSYTHSFGMETYIQADKIRTKSDLLTYCKSYLQHNLGCGDAIIVKEAYHLAKEQNIEELIRLEKKTDAIKLAEEARNGSVMIGRQFLKTVLPLEQLPEIVDWQQKINEKKIKGHFAVIYGIYAACLDFDLEVAILTFLYSSVTALVHNAVRAVPFGQSTGVASIHELIPFIEQITKEVLNSSMNDISNRSLGIEISSMEHQFLYSRLFIS